MKHLFTLLSLLLLLPVAALAQETNVPYIYYEWNESSQTLTRHDDGKAATATVVTANDTEWKDGWYVAKGIINISSRVTVTGNVHLILANECSLTVNGGIRVSEGNSLTIYAQSTGGETMGKLTAMGDSGNACIGGSNDNYYKSGGTVTIYGGTVNATSNNGDGAGIGGGSGFSGGGGSGGTVTIYSGLVTASGGSGSGAGIGGGWNGSGGTVTIYSGLVTATGGSYGGAGIGGGGGSGFGGGSGTVTIFSGGVVATGNGGGAGIGGGCSGSGDKVTIHGGTVNATSNGGGAGIGGGAGGSGGMVTISGGMVNATIDSGSYGGAGIGGGCNGGNGGEITISGGDVTAKGGTTGAGIGGGSEGGSGGTVTISGDAIVTATGGSDAAGIGGGAGSSADMVTISGGMVKATGNGGGAGIGGGYGSGGTITISGDAIVTATGGSYGGAGIGGGQSGSGDKVSISGGTVTAIGKGGGAGIGGGGGGEGGGGTVIISGGTVTATGGSDDAAGIGGGEYGESGTFSTKGTDGTEGNAFIITSSIQDNDDTSGWSGVFFIGSDAGAVYGSPTLTSHAIIPAGKTLVVEGGKTLTIGKGVTLKMEDGATLTNNGRIVNYGTIYGKVEGTGTVAIPLTAEMIELEEESFTYTGSAIEPEVTVSNEGVIYGKDTDYTVSYSDNNNIVGTATVTVKPIDDYQSALLGDAVVKEFTIEKATPTITLTVPTEEELVYDGKAKEATAKVKGVENESEELTATIAYYSDDTYQTEVKETKDAGTYYVKATFAGNTNYNAAEDVTAKFTITQATATLSFEEETVSATIGETVENTLTVDPAGVTVIYKSSDVGVATVDASGVITLVGAGETTITATINDPNYQGEAASYTLTVTQATLDEDKIAAEGETNISIEMDGTSFELTAKVTVDEPGTGGTWVWTSSDINVATVSEKGDAASGYSLRATTDPKTSTAIVTPVAAGTATITATYTDSKYTGSVDFTVSITEPYVPKPPVDPISYYNIYVEDVCEGVEVTTSKNVVREGGTISLYVEKDTANYTFDNFQVYYKRSYYGPWEVLEEGVQPGEYPIRNIWTHIYVKAEGAEEKEDPTGIEQVEGVKVYTKDGSLYVQTPQREQVLVITMTGVVVKNEEQVGLKQYHGLQPGIYVVRIGERAYKLRLN